MVPVFVLALLLYGLVPARADSDTAATGGSRVIYVTNGGLGQGYVPRAKKRPPRDVKPMDYSFLEEGYTASERTPVKSSVLYTTGAPQGGAGGLEQRRATRTAQEGSVAEEGEKGGLSTGTDESISDDEFLDEEEEDLAGLNGEEAAPVADPLEGFNRLIFKINDKLYFWFLRPVALGYSHVVPEPGRVAVRRFFANAYTPVRFANNVLQFKFKNAAEEVARFVINTTLGVAGFMDPAKKWWNMEMHEEDFGQTLGFYGFGPGLYLNLPVFGPSNIRDTIGMVADIFASPTAYILPNDREIVVGINAYQKVNEASLNIGLYEGIKRDALDPYIFIRNAYQQHRVSEIKK